MSLLRRQYNRFLEEKKHSVKDQSIKFLTHKSEYVHLAPPIHAKDYYPRWYKNLSRQDDQNKKTLKTCPSIFDIMTEGYIIPLWLDLKIKNYNGVFEWDNNGVDEITIETFGPSAVDGMPLNDSTQNTVFKFVNPWNIITPPGWSVYITQPWYHRNLDFEILPGIIETDSYHQSNLPFIYKSVGDAFYKQGTPLAQVIPFKRKETLNLVVEEMDKLDMKYYTNSRAAERTQVKGYYRWLTKKNKQKWKLKGIL